MEKRRKKSRQGAAMVDAFIVEAVRIAGGKRQGRLADWHPVSLGAAVLNALIERVRIDGALIEDVVMGCVTQVGEQSINVARNVVLASLLPDSVPAVSVDRQCGSSQQALHFAAQAVMSGAQDVVIAAGVESMTRVPMGAAARLAAEAGIGTGPLTQAIRQRYGVSSFSQFRGAQMLAEKYGLSRHQLDEFALLSHQKASRATSDGAFSDEIVPVEGKSGDGSTVLHVSDEGVRGDASLHAIGAVKLVEEGGSISAANASQICDGASALLVASERAVKRHGLVPIARVHGMSVTAGDPVMMVEEPIGATRRVLERTGLTIADIDLYEVNEAFASVPLAWLAALDADPARLNVNGGAIALGHPLGASGARLATTLIHALGRSGKRFGLQTMCEGGGLANATIFERL
jgi:acetyl-CoA C-acetyltransferase